MTRKDLLGSYGEREALAVYNALKPSGDFIGFAQSFMHDEDYQVARNALWTLTKATDEELSSLQPILNELIDLAITTDNSSVRRLSMNVIERLKITEDNLRTDFLDFCFDHAIDPAEYPGIQSLCMKLAFRMAVFYPELKGEFMRIVEDMDMQCYSPAVKSVRNRILRGKLK